MCMCKSIKINLKMTNLEIGLLKRPQVSVISSVHHLGTPLHVNCSAQLTDPPPHISFYINDNKVSLYPIKSTIIIIKVKITNYYFKIR